MNNALTEDMIQLTDTEMSGIVGGGYADDLVKGTTAGAGIGALIGAAGGPPGMVLGAIVGGAAGYILVQWFS